MDLFKFDQNFDEIIFLLLTKNHKFYKICPKCIKCGPSYLQGVPLTFGRQEMQEI
jgi:hypothetical protein